MTREQAERAVRRDFGNVTQIEERSREVWQWPTFESILADLRYTLRQLRRAPGFALTAIIVLALGIGIEMRSSFGACRPREDDQLGIGLLLP